jgi:hypothetical protein
MFATFGQQTCAAPDKSSEAQHGQIKTIDFQTSKSVGQLSVGRINDTLTWTATKNLGDAVGKVNIPANADVMLKVNYYGSEHLAFLDALKPDDLTALSLNNGGGGYEIQDKEFSRLGRLTGLKLLDLEASEAASQAMEAVSHLTNLRHLNLSDTMIKDRDTNALAKLGKLESLNINHNDLSDATFSHIQNSKHLTNLVAKRSGLTRAGVKYLTNLTNLRSLRLASDKIGDAGVQSLPPLDQLTELDIGDCDLTPACISSLSKFPKLAYLFINRCKPSKEAFAAVSKLKSIAFLSITGEQCNAADLILLQNAKKLSQMMVTIPIHQQKEATKILPHVQFQFQLNKSGVPLEIFAPVH